MTARAEGLKVGRRLGKPSLNPYDDGTADGAAWDLGWHEGSAETLAQADEERRARERPIAAESCTDLEAK